MEKPKGSLIGYMSSLVKTGGGINCAQGIPGFNPPEELILALAECAKQQVHQYAAGNGIVELRELIAGVFLKRADFNQNNIMITNGATEAISLIYLYLRQKLKKEFSVLSFDPVYESYWNLPRIYGDKFVPFYPEKTGLFDFDLLETTVIKEKISLIIICSPGNPFGKVWKKEEISRIHDICRKNGVYLILDLVYSDIYFNNPPYLPYEMIDESTFVVSAFSKMLSITGWRVGYIAGEKKNIDDITQLHDYTGLCAPSILQAAILKYLRENDFGKTYLDNLRPLIKKSYKTMLESLNNSGFKTPDIDGGYFIWTKIPEKFDNGFDFAINLYEKKKVGTVPGIHFSSRGEKYIRISIVRNIGEISEASERIKEFVTNY